VFKTDHDQRLYTVGPTLPQIALPKHYRTIYFAITTYLCVQTYSPKPKAPHGCEAMMSRL
jgi:hypothetical protein